MRYIAVNDGVDTLNKSAMDITPFRNILNEMYSADVSVKIKSAYRARFQQGKFMGTTAPYGYVKDPADHNHLLIDDKVAHVVREIFDLALAGNGIAKIRKHINKQHILRPAAYAVEQGATGYERYFEDNEENRYIWSENSVRGILRSPIYAGNLAGYKRIAANMKSKKRPSKLPEEWEVIPDTHEGIVTQEEFDTVQQLMTSRRREQNAGGFENIFSGVIKCADCGYAMRAASANRRKRPDIIDCVQYTCNNYGRYGNVMCTAHSIEARDLFNAVLADINRFADMAVNDEKAVRAIERRLTETDQSRAKSLEKEKKKLNKRLAELDWLFSSLYEDKVMERITERNFEMMSGKYQKEQLEIEARLKEVTETLNDSYEKSQGVRDFLSLIRNYQGLKELDATIINALIDKILVSEREKLADGTVRQEIKIYYKFIGFVGELHITPTKRWTALKPKNCTVCGVEYVPSSGISKYCPACAKRIQREKSNESKRRSRERNRRACIELSAKNDRLMLASGVISGQFEAEWVYDREDVDGLRYEDEMIRIGYKGEKENRLHDVKAYLEPHIEQGPVLDATGKNMGIVTGALGITGLDITIKGEANHAGTTPMSHRKDALCAAADAICRIEKNCIEFGEPAVITNGIINAQPASKNIVPGEVYFSIDLRYHTDEGMAELEEQTKAIIRKTCEEHGVEVEIQQYWRAKPAKFNDTIVNCVAQAAEENGMDAVKIISGAGHDAVFINDVIPTGMIFVPSIKGMSHCPQENTKWEDIVKGAEVTADVLLKMDKADI